MFRTSSTGAALTTAAAALTRAGLWLTESPAPPLRRSSSRDGHTELPGGWLAEGDHDGPGEDDSGHDDLGGGDSGRDDLDDDDDADHHEGDGAGDFDRWFPDAGQATTEYALVLLGAALVALLLIAWATAGGGAGKIGRLFDRVLDAITGKF